MKKIFSVITTVLFLGIASSVYADTQNNAKLNEALANPNSSVNFALKMKAGWNLGNTLDAYANNDKVGFTLNSETCWGMPKTTKTMIKKVHDTGFTTIRIPVSWHGHLSNNPEDPYKVDSEWMKRVKEVVNMAYDEGMYVILNIHHDNLSTVSGRNEGTINSKGYNGNKLLGYVMDKGFKRQSKFFLKSIWTQIAENFNEEYGDRLIFEIVNEPRNVGASDEWYVSDQAKLADYNKLLLEYEQACLDVIRESGKNNANRYVMITGYAANPQLTKDFVLPTDSADDKLLLSFHAYVPYPFAMWDANAKEPRKEFDKSCKGEIEWNYQTLEKNFLQLELFREKRVLKTRTILKNV